MCGPDKCLSKHNRALPVTASSLTLSIHCPLYYYSLASGHVAMSNRHPMMVTGTSELSRGQMEMDAPPERSDGHDHDPSVSCPVLS